MIRQIILRNWMCFRGEHVINLEPKAYAVTAKYDVDPGRSNRGGKSAIFEAVQFVVTGKLNKDRRSDADGWISVGERSGGVGLVLDDNVCMKRERSRGSSTKVTYSTPHMDKPATGDAAETALLEHLLFGVDDYATVAYFAQGAMAKLIRTEPEKRFDIIRAWLGLSKAEKAEDLASDEAKRAVRETQKLKARLKTIAELLESMGEELSDEVVTEMLDRRTKAKAKIERLTNERQQLDQRGEHEEIVKRFDDVIARGSVVKKEIAEFDPNLEETTTRLEKEYNEVYAAIRQAAADTTSKHRVSLGQFDGRCPVANIECPAKKQINTDRKAAKEAFEAAHAIEKELLAKKEALLDEIHEHNVKVKQLRAKQSVREELRRQAAAIRDDAMKAKEILKSSEVSGDRAGISEKLRTLQSTLEVITADIARVEQQKEHRKKLELERETLTKSLERESKFAATAVQTRAIFRATQRRLAERALDRIGTMANNMLINSGDTLRVGIQWEHEAKQLAKNCEMCGAAFPTSRKVKECAECQSERGQQIVHRLEFPLNESSGGGDDWAGIALQVAAGSWLLSERESPWATAMIDEPFSQMDRTIRRAAAKQLLNIVGNSAFRQAFVISHSQETVEMYPARLNIVVAKDGTRTIYTS